MFSNNFLNKKLVLFLFLNVSLIFSYLSAQNQVAKSLLSYDYFTKEHQFALKEFKKLPPKKKQEVIRQLRAAFSATSEKIKYNATWAIVRLGLEAKEAIPELVFALKDKNKMVRGNALWALGKMEKFATPHLPLIIAALEDQEWYVRYNAAKSLGVLGIRQPQIIPILIHATKEEDYRIRLEAVWVLGKLKMDSELLIQAVIECFQDRNYQVRLKSLSSLAEIGPKVLPVVEPLLESKNLIEQQCAALLLFRLKAKKEKAFLVLQNILALEEEQNCLEIIRGLAESGSFSVPFLISILKKKNFKFALYVKTKLLQLAPNATYELLEILKTGEAKERFIALRLLVISNSNSLEVREVLSKLLIQEKDKDFKKKLFNALECFKNEGESYQWEELEKWEDNR